jgi:hypothetical protein
VWRPYFPSPARPGLARPNSRPTGADDTIVASPAPLSRATGRLRLSSRPTGDPSPGLASDVACSRPTGIGAAAKPELTVPRSVMSERGTRLDRHRTVASGLSPYSMAGSGTGEFRPAHSRTLRASTRSPSAGHRTKPRCAPGLDSEQQRRDAQLILRYLGHEPPDLEFLSYADSLAEAD